MTIATADLEEELGVSSEATLKVPPRLTIPILLVFTPQSDVGNELVTISSSSPCSPNDGGGPGCLSTKLSLESSMRGDAARCLVMGRQASASDIRIDHKSVSRRHTALYYNHGSGCDDEKDGGVGALLVVQDLGGKHGTCVDGARLDKNCKIELPLRGVKEYVIRIGNAPLTCRVILPDMKSDEQDSASISQKDDESHRSPPTKDATPTDHITEKVDTAVDAPSTRESREAQIAAMIASLESEPVYEKYVPTDEENFITESMNNLSSGVKNNDKVDNGSNINTNANTYNLPISSSITLAPGSNSFASSDGTNTPLQAKASVATLCFEPSGARLVAGHRDGTLRFYDFHGMQPSHVITALGASAGGGQWIVGTTSAQPRVLDREGRTTLFHFIKGDTYVTDSTNTKGHTATVTGVAFHPLVKDICWTCGLDGSIRQWDLSGKGKFQFQKLVCQKLIGKCKNEKGQRTQIVSNLSIHPSGRKLVVGTSCGSIQIWNCFGSGTNSRPMGAVYSAHGGLKPVSFVTYSGNGERIASRSESDDTVKIWDATAIDKGAGSLSRKFNSQGKEGEHSPSLLLATCKGLPALNESANCAFGPDGRVICAGTSVDPRASNPPGSCYGQIKFYVLPNVDKQSKMKKETDSKASKKTSTITLDPVVELNVAPDASVLGVQWHPKMNQIAFGTSNGM